jgi:hypothetical protein
MKDLDFPIESGQGTLETPRRVQDEATSELAATLRNEY